MFEGLTLEQLALTDWDAIEVDGKDCILFLRAVYQDVPGFDFHCVEWHSTESDEIVLYETMFEGVAYFDGVRHLYFGSEKSENYGYLYCCNVPRLVKALQALDALQVSKLPYVRERRGNG